MVITTVSDACCKGEGREAPGSEHSDRLAEGQEEGTERVRAKLKVMQETVMGTQVGGTVTALPGMMEGESRIFQIARTKKHICGGFFACASGAAF